MGSAIPAQGDYTEAALRSIGWRGRYPVAGLANDDISESGEVVIVA